MLKQLSCFILLLGTIAHTVLAQPFPKSTQKIYLIQSVGKPEGYKAKLLELALSYSDKAYNLSEFSQVMPKERRLILLNQGKELHIGMGSATKYREEEYLAVPFPIIKGLNGWRIPLVNADTPDLFKNITSLEELKKLSPVQFHSWSDTAILTSNGISVSKGGSVEGLYHMLDKKRVDYLPRSITEIDLNLKQHQHLNIKKDEYVLLYYPSAYYFYVGRSNTELATDINRGLEKALKDGEFDKLFMMYHSESVKKIQQAKRHVFTLHNPFLPEVIPLERKELWIRPLYQSH